MLSQKRRITKIIISALVVLVFLFQAMHIDVYAQTGQGNVQVTNGFVQYSVSARNGRFAIKTDQGAPRRDDANQKLLFMENEPETSFTTFKIDGKEYIYGNAYGFMGLSSGFSRLPQVVGRTTISTWMVGNVEITQRLELIEDRDNPNVGNVRISYHVMNRDNKEKEIGTRILLDTMLGSNDGAPIFVPGRQDPITHETILSGSDVPQYWRGTDNLFAPKVVSYGFTQGWGNMSPNQMVIAHWNGLSETKWDYWPDQNLNFTQSNNKYGSSDSAVALYWDTIKIRPGESRVFETYYGIGNFSNLNEQANYSLNVIAPEKLVLNESKTGYVEDTFEIIAEIDNTQPGSVNLTNVTASLILEEGLVLTEEQIPYLSVDTIPKNQMMTFKWTVKAANSETFTSRQYRVDINSDNHSEPFSRAGFIVLPGIKGEPPQIQFHSISPQKLYFEGPKTFTIKGTGYDVYMNKNLWRLLVINEKTNAAIQVPRDNIIVRSDSISVQFDNKLEKGNYLLRIEHDDFGTTTLKNKLEATDDARFQSKSYGVLYIKKTNIEKNDWEYSIEMADSMEELNRLEKRFSDEEELLLSISGDIRETVEDGKKVYRVNQQAVLNSVLQYEGTPLVIQKVPGTNETNGRQTITIEGDGKLTLENGFSFWWWSFEINITDGANYVTEFAGSGQKNLEVELTGLGRVAKWVAGLAIQIENAIILKEGVSFGGKMNLAIPGAKKDELPSLNIEINKVLFGMQNEAFGFVGIDSKAQFKAPKETIPITWISKGFEATLVINTIDGVFGIEAQADIKICEAYVKLTFIKNQSSGWWLPNDIVLAGTFNPGWALGPTGLFLNKVGGGVEDLFGTITGDRSLPPLTVTLIAGVNMAKVIQLSAKLSMSKNGFSLEGEGEIARIKALKEVKVALTWARPRSFELSAKLSLLSTIEGGISLYIGEDRWEGIVYAGIKFPDNLPVVGGRQIFAISMGANNHKIWGPVPVMGIPVMVTYYWGKNIEFKLPFPWASDGEFYADNLETGLYATTLTDEHGEGVVMVVGGNIRRVGSSNGRNTVYASADTGFIAPSLHPEGMVYASSGNTEHFLNIQNQTMALMEFRFTGSEPNLQVFRPDGTLYPLIRAEQDPDRANMLVQIIKPEDSNSGQLEQYVFITVINPEDGVWKVVSDKPVTSSLFDVLPVPTFNTVEVDQIAENQIQVTWDANHTENTLVNLFLAKDQSSSGTHIGVDIDGKAGHYTLTIPNGVEEGEYFIRATIDKGEEGFDNRYTSSTIFVTDPYKPQQASNITAQPYGNGLILVNWDKAIGEGIEGYVITVYDKHGNVVESIGHQFADGNQTTILLGGQYTMQETGGTAGLEPGHEYRVGMVTNRRIGDEEYFTSHFSDVAYSNIVYLPKPNPAVISVSLGEGFIDGYNKEGEKTKISNHEAVTVSFTSNQSEVSTDVFVNGSLYQSTEGDSFEVVIPTVDGDYNVHFVTTNENQDTSTATTRFTIDRTPPVLMVDSPIQGQLSMNGEILVKGNVEKSAHVTVNGMTVAVDSAGSFSYVLPMGNAMKKDVLIEVTDKASNVTRYQAEVINDTVKTISGIFIRPDVNQMVAGDSQRFEAVAIDGLGREFLLEGNVQWSLLMGQSLAKVDSDGLVNTIGSGDLILKAAYYISETYSFEDAIVIEVLPVPNSIDDGADKDLPSPGSGTGEGGSGSSGVSRIDRELERILANIIRADQNITPFDVVDVRSDRSITIQLKDGARLDIPAHTIGENDKLLVGIVKDTSQYINESDFYKKLLSPVYMLQFALTSGRFNEPLQLTFTYDDNNVFNLDKVGVYYFNEAFGMWQYIGGVIDPVAKEITVNLHHFSKYALIEDAAMVQFSDIRGRWSENLIKGLYSLGIVSGIQEQNGFRFEPQRNITRLEFAKLVLETLLLTGQISAVKEDGELPFADARQIPEWGRDYAALAYRYEIIRGRGTPQGFVFDANAPITKAEAAVIVGRTLGELGNAETDFVDAAEFPFWAKEYIGALYNRHIIKGNPDKTFMPNKNLTREEAASMILNWIY